MKEKNNIQSNIINPMSGRRPNKAKQRVHEQQITRTSSTIEICLTSVVSVISDIAVLLLFCAFG